MALVLLFTTRRLLADDEEAHGEAVINPPPPDAAERASVGRFVLLAFAGMFAVVAEITGGDWASFRLADDFAAKGALSSLAFVATRWG